MSDERQVELLQRRIDADFPKPVDSHWPGGYPNDIEAALIDTTYSVQAKYGSEATGVRAVVARWRAERDGAADDLNALAAPAGRGLADVARNDAVLSGRRKYEVVGDAARALVAVGVQHSSDLADPETREHAKAAWMRVHGLAGVTWAYFSMLVGYPDVKADVHIRRYVAEALDQPDVSEELARSLLHQVTSPFADVTHLDHAVWRLQSNRGAPTS
ncbi:hypothetical protein [Aeromicrobium sp. NPDC092404]|uniref:hypothetical protein n=1 Tax=Aeromicrobium sp. NPDC092404 TaxID=3154976 RepID=UPI00343491E8